MTRDEDTINAPAILSKQRARIAELEAALADMTRQRDELLRVEVGKAAPELGTAEWWSFISEIPY